MFLLASQSAARRRLLEAAGLKVESRRHGLDEGALKRQYGESRCRPEDIAEALAAEKAVSVSRQWPKTWVIGGDQLLVCDGQFHSKPADFAAAAAQLRRLRGRRHHLPTAVALAHAGKIVWRYSETPELIMRRFSEAFLERYLGRAGADVLAAVGSYAIEAEGIQLFKKIDGDSFAIQGLPLLPLLGDLRRRGLLAR